MEREERPGAEQVCYSNAASPCCEPLPKLSPVCVFPGIHSPVKQLKMLRVPGSSWRHVSEGYFHPLPTLRVGGGLCQRGDSETAAEASSSPLRCRGRGPLGAESSSSPCTGRAGHAAGGRAMPGMPKLGLLGCQDGSQSPPAFQAACCRGSNQLSFTSPAPDHPKTPATSPQVSGKAPSPVCQSYQHPYFMFTHMWRQVPAPEASGRTAFRTALGCTPRGCLPPLHPSYQISH